MPPQRKEMHNCKKKKKKKKKKKLLKKHPQVPIREMCPKILGGYEYWNPPNEEPKEGGKDDRDLPWFSLILVKTIIFFFCVEKVSSGM